MTSKILLLFFTPLIAGLLIYLVPKGRNTNFKLLLVFAGSYLFSITVIHILPELYHQTAGAEWIGLFVLAGFFLQQLLEYFTSGIEHGHIHTHNHSGNHEGHSHHAPRTISAIVLLIALCVHAFLEGGMLAQPLHNHHHGIEYDMDAILIGICLHRAPAAFALMTVLSVQLGSRKKSIPYLIGFSVAAPAGLLLSTYLTSIEVLSGTGMVLLYALVSGNFLHISTTIVFESSPEHHFNGKKMAVALFGAAIAVITEQFI